jgi:hypothetical protein
MRLKLSSLIATSYCTEAPLDIIHRHLSRFLGVLTDFEFRIVMLNTRTLVVGLCKIFWNLSGTSCYSWMWGSAD